MMPSEEYERARKAAYRILTYRARTEYEIREKLFQKGFNKEIISQVITSLKDYRMIDDQTYAESLVSSGQRCSPVELSGKLRRIGIKESIIEKVLETVDPEAEYRIALTQALSRKKRLGDKYSLERVAYFLRTRGFNQEVIERVYNYLEGMPQPRDLDS